MIKSLRFVFLALFVALPVAFPQWVGIRIERDLD